MIDEVSYDPLRQRENDTIYYHVPQYSSNSVTRFNGECTSDKSKQTLKRRAIAIMYNKLALAYRTDEDKTITGVLKHTYHVPTSTPPPLPLPPPKTIATITQNSYNSDDYNKQSRK